MTIQLPWDTLRSIVGGRSAIDAPHMHCHDLADAEAFLECYGFDTHRAEHLAELAELRQLAVEFIETELLDDERIPDAVRNEEDVRSLLVWASDRVSTERSAWSCAILRVAHTLAHSRSYFNDKYGVEIRSQIFSRFEPHLNMGAGALKLGSGEDAIELVDFEVRPAKPVFSVALKLLHKVENVAEDIFDRFGVRFITQRRFDALLVVKYLREHNVFMFANVKPSRSRNTLVDLAWLEDLMSGLDTEVEGGRMDDVERLELLRQAVDAQAYPAPPHSVDNPHSSASYHAVQFTCRQMIRVPDDTGQREIRFFFPFEVQILDDESYRRSRSGYAAHDLYKARQRQAVRQRVLGRLIR